MRRARGMRGGKAKVVRVRLTRGMEGGKMVRIRRGVEERWVKER